MNQDFEGKTEDELSALAKTSNKYAKLYLQYLEYHRIDRPKDVIEYGDKLLKSNSVTNKYKWRLMERVFLSCLELNNSVKAKKYLFELKDKFGQSSNRFVLLLGIFWQGVKDYTEAAKYYKNILESNNNSIFTMKRKVALLIEKRNINKAIEELCKYLKLYGSDEEGWKQLMELYMEQHNYEYAKFCCEELLLMGGENYLLHLQMGEILYNIGDQNNLQLGVKYFCQSIILGGDSNCRGLWGLLLTLKNLKDINYGIDKNLFDKTCIKLQKLYSQKSNSYLQQIVKSILVQLNNDN